MPVQEKTQINRLLMSHGLGRLEDGAGLLAQLGYLVRDHDHFRSMLAGCEPENRRAMYESMRPYLRFPAKTLDAYLTEARQQAEARQLPTIDPETGQFRPYKVAEIRQAQEALEEGLAKGHLELVCKKCTKAEVFSGFDKADAVKKAREAGWVYSALGEGVEICPDCPASRCI